ncbi:MAG: putative bifunctional diguanylate cyclase/phosphodiesterase, partial [Hyphomicrobiales bacterium]
DDTAQDDGAQAVLPGAMSAAPAGADPAYAAGTAAPAPSSTSQDSNHLSQAIMAVGHVVYEWRVEEDRLTWSHNASEILGVANIDAIASGREFANLLDPENAANRYETVMSTAQVDEGEGVPFQIEYRILPKGRDSGGGYWVEDTGRWYAGRNGRPARVVGILRNIEDRYQRDQQLSYLSCFDQLTGLMNRTHLADSLTEAIGNAERFRMPCAFLLCAVDNLAMVNDAYGFDVADQVISVVGQRLKSTMRTGDAIGRYAGNKFGLILANCSESDMKVAAQRLLKVVRDTVVETDAGPVSATVSIGGLSLPHHARTSDEAMVRAEEALDLAKAKHRDSFVIYKHSQKRESIRKRNIMFADEIISALNGRRLVIAYQPIVNVDSENPALYECLLRLIKPDNEIVSAGHFIPVAEQLGLVRLIDHRVLELTIETLEESKDAYLSLNISGMTATDPRWLSNLTAYISAHRDAAERLTVEITETAALQDLEESCKFISTLRDLGCKVAIDDFGAGYTSFRNLKTLDVDMVKLDGSFCDRLADNKDNQFFVRTLIDLAQNFNIKTVAERVEEQRDGALLKTMGVDYLQGYLYGRAEIQKPWLGDHQIPDKPLSAL